MAVIGIFISIVAGIALGLPFASSARLAQENRKRNFKRTVEAAILYDMLTGNKGNISIFDMIPNDLKPLSKEDDEFIASYYRQEIQNTKKYKKKFAKLQERINKLQELRHTMKETVEQGKVEQKIIEAEQHRNKALQIADNPKVSPEQ